MRLKIKKRPVTAKKGSPIARIVDLGELSLRQFYSVISGNCVFIDGRIASCESLLLCGFDIHRRIRKGTLQVFIPPAGLHLPDNFFYLELPDGRRIAVRKFSRVMPREMFLKYKRSLLRKRRRKA